jgi:chemotaxis signal transduction protein
MEPAPSITGGTDAAYIEGVINLADRILIVLSLSALFQGDLKGLPLAA